MLSKEAAIRFENKYKAITETKDDITPKTKASFLVNSSCWYWS